MPKSGKDKAAKQEKVARGALKRQFKKFDKDGSGALDKAELKSFMRALSVGAPGPQRRAFYKLYEANKDKPITFKQFEAALATSTKKTEKKVDEVMKTFKKFDKDGNGTLEGAEIKKAMQALGETTDSKSRKRLFQKYDTNHDGKLSFKEFKVMVNHLENTDKDKRLAHKVFVKFDKDKSGRIEGKEMKEFLASLSLATSGQQRLALRNATKKHDKGLSEAEFAKVFETCREEAAKRTKQMKKVFKSADKDKSGELDRKELAAVVKSLGIDISSDDLKKNLKKVDADGDGQLDFGEFKELMFVLQDTY